MRIPGRVGKRHSSDAASHHSHMLKLSVVIHTARDVLSVHRFHCAAGGEVRDVYLLCSCLCGSIVLPNFGCLTNHEFEFSVVFHVCEVMFGSVYPRFLGFVAFGNSEDFLHQEFHNCWCAFLLLSSPLFFSFLFFSSLFFSFLFFSFLFFSFLFFSFLHFSSPLLSCPLFSSLILSSRTSSSLLLCEPQTLTLSPSHIHTVSSLRFFLFSFFQVFISVCGSTPFSV